MFTKIERYESPIVNADRWLRSENLRIALGTAHAARLAAKAIRRENREIKRTQRGRWN